MTSDQPARRFVFVLLIASLLVVGYVAWPIATALLIAAVLAVVLAPVQERLSRWLRGRRAVAAGILVLAVLFLLVGPLLGLTTVLVKEAADGVRFIQDTVRGQGVAGLVEKLPPPLDAYARNGLESLGDLGQLAQKHVIEQGPRAASAVAAALKATGALVFDLAMMLIALFFLLMRGSDLIAWVDSVSPLAPAQTRQLVAEFRKVSYAVIVATVATAAVQAAVAGIGYVIAGVPHPMFFTALTFFVALIPAIGAAGVCLFAALIEVATGHPYMALFLAVWGIVVVGLIDNIVKPFLIKGDLEMGGAVVFFALIGGIAAFGMVGLLVGPLAVATFLTLLRMYRRDFLS
ncbi:MAG TPA: AI-2E family transporter [Burkholderiales bacterium]|nr:AI-2E family transporter [Burkholderiales bacterium]